MLIPPVAPNIQPEIGRAAAESPAFTCCTVGSALLAAPTSFGPPVVVLLNCALKACS